MTRNNLVKPPIGHPSRPPANVAKQGPGLNAPLTSINVQSFGAQPDAQESSTYASFCMMTIATYNPPILRFLAQTV